MNSLRMLFILSTMILASSAYAQEQFQSDIIRTSGGDLTITALEKVRREKTVVALNEAGAGQVSGGVVLKNGDKQTIEGITIEAVPAYNIEGKRENGQPYHPKGVGNGYIVTFGDKRAYIAGDTENIPEMKEFKHIDIAFLPMNLPYTMTPEMAAAAAKMIQPKVFYPYHTGDTDIAKLTALTKDQKGTEVRIRKMQ